jgi:hemoglobin-like flavoprotein
MSLNVALLRQSFELCVARSPKLTGRFYEILFERYPAARAMFPTNRRAHQATALAHALLAVVEHVDDPAWLKRTLHGLGARHVQYGVTDEMFDWVGDSLLATLRRRKRLVPLRTSAPGPKRTRWWRR